MFLGRDGELAELRGLIDASRPVAVLGEAGVGKTALVREAASIAGWSLVEAGALSTLSWHPYFPLRRVLGREPGGDHAYVAAEVERVVGDGLLFLDDMHWADRETREAIPYLAGRVRIVAAIRRGDPAALATVDELGTAGFSLLDLEPLGQEAAVALAGALRPGMSPAAADRLVERAGGNPLLIEELAASGEPTESLQFALAARLRSLSTAGREAMGLLALVGRPFDEAAVLDGGGELVEAGLAVRENGHLAVRHSLLAEAATAELDPDERCRLHLRLIEDLDDPGEVARHLAAAGERKRAFVEAMRAVDRSTTPGERALHLELAAAMADGTEADELRLRAATALTEAARYEAAAAVLDELAEPDADMRARSLLLRAQAALEVTDLDGAHTLVAEGLALSSETTRATAIALRLEHLKLDLEGAEADPCLISRARELLDDARRDDQESALAYMLLARSLRQGSDESWDAEMLNAIDAARREGRVGIELRAAEAYLVGSLQQGHPRTAQRFAATQSARARALRLASWERRFRMRGAWLLMHSGRFRAAFEEAESLLDEVLEDWERYMVSYCAAQSASDLGFHERALARATDLQRQASGELRVTQASWARADAAYWAGRPAEATRWADDAIAGFPLDGIPLVHVTRAWSRLECGLDPGDEAIESSLPMLAGAHPELEAVTLLAGGQYERAASVFREAELLWRHRHARGRLRCAWAEGEALRLAGLRGEALPALLRAERLASAYEHAPLLARIRRSLRLLGELRSASRGTTNVGVTSREREVLELVGAGLSNAEIARRLGVGRPTVERIVQTASRKLGAKTRAQAAALAAGR